MLNSMRKHGTTLAVSVNDSEEIVDEEPTQSGNNVGEEEGNSHEDFEDLLESEMFDESSDEEMPSKNKN